MRFAIVGAHGQLGAAVVHACRPAHDVTAFVRSDFDVTDDRAVASALDRARPDVIVNCTAYNAVDAAEDHPVDALSVNAFAVRALSRAAAALNAVLIHYSTDFVFDGAKGAQYTEEDRPNPRGVYAASKLAGEWFAADAPRAYVLRVESLFGCAPDRAAVKGSVAMIVEALRAGRDVRVFEDRTVSPTYVIDGAWATRRLVESNAPPGVYHLVNSGFATWLELARELADQLGVTPHLVPTRLEDVATRAERPRFCALSNRKLVAAGIQMPTWQDAVARYLAADGRNARPA